MDTTPATSEYDIWVIRTGDVHGLYIGYKPHCMWAELMEVIKELRLSEWADREVHPLHPLNWEDDSDDGDYEPKSAEEESDDEDEDDDCDSMEEDVESSDEDD